MKVYWILVVVFLLVGAGCNSTEITGQIDAEQEPQTVLDTIVQFEKIDTESREAFVHRVVRNMYPTVGVRMSDVLEGKFTTEERHGYFVLYAPEEAPLSQGFRAFLLLESEDAVGVYEIQEVDQHESNFNFAMTIEGVAFAKLDQQEVPGIVILTSQTRLPTSPGEPLSLYETIVYEWDEIAEQYSDFGLGDGVGDQYPLEKVKALIEQMGAIGA